MESLKNRSAAMLWSGAAHIAAVLAALLVPPPMPELPPVPPPFVRVALTEPPKPLEAPPAPKVQRVARLDLPVVRVEPQAPMDLPEVPKIELESKASVELPLERPTLESPAPRRAPVLAAATAADPRPQPPAVQSAGFEGAPVQAPGPSRQAKLNVGAFEGLSSAPGGSPGAGRRAEVRQAGFGGALAGTAAGKPGPTVASGGFGAMTSGGTTGQSVVTASAGFGQVSGEKATARLERDAAVPRLTPVEILSKPKPVYTAEAREQRIEGEVTLRVRFGADGRIEVLEVLRGLGHGLEETAARAVEAMQFKPARSNGVPVDSVLSVAVAFSLAY